MTDWKTMDSAPKDGTWFLCLRAVTVIGGGHPDRARPELEVLHRHRTTAESDGYWQSSYGNSVADSYVAGGLWAPLDALPLRELWQSIEDKRRVYDTYVPRDLPVPLGTGRTA